MGKVLSFPLSNRCWTIFSRLPVHRVVIAVPIPQFLKFVVGLESNEAAVIITANAPERRRRSCREMAIMVRQGASAHPDLTVYAPCCHKRT